MSRVLSWGPVLFLLLLLGLPAVAVAQAPTEERGVLVGVREAVTLDAGSSAQVVVGVQGQVTVQGHARLVVMVDGPLNVGPNASVDTIVAVRAQVTLGPGATIGTIRSLDSTITQDPTSTIQNGIQDLSGSAIVLVGVLGTFLVLLWLGWAVATLLSAAVVAAMGATQMRRMARSISNEPLKVLGAGVVGLFVPIIVAVLLFVTVIGIPLGFLVFLVMGLAGFLGFIALGVWLGDLLLRKGKSPSDGKPVGSALLGVFLLLVVGFIPLVSLLIGWFALGTATLNGWRAFRAQGGGGELPAIAGFGSTGWADPQAGWGAPQTGWSPPPQPQQPTGPPPGWGQPPAAPGTQQWGQPPAAPGTQQWGQQPQPPAGPPQTGPQGGPPQGGPPQGGPPPGWGQPPDQGR